MGDMLFDGKYRILKTLGSGGSGSVFLAENVRLGTLWAIKEIRKTHGESVQFVTEPHVLKNLRHPALPRIFDIIENADALYIVQDYIEGRTLEEILIREGPVSESRLLDWAIEICDVYRYLHGQRPNPIIYRDMKPQNLIVDHGGRIRLIDFGIAREFKTDSLNDTVCLGTRGYAAPEQYGTSQTDPRSDIYSLGVTLYHAITGHGPNEPPFERPLLTECEGQWSIPFARVIDKALRADPGQRFQSASEMHSALEEHKKSLTKSNAVITILTQHFAGPIIFGVGGVEGRCGTTHHAVMLAHYLSRTRREKVPLVEYNSSPCLAALNPRNEVGVFQEKGVVYHPGSPQNNMEGLNFNDFREYRYVVLDLGVLKPFKDGVMVSGLSHLEMTRVHCPILVASGSPWRLNSLIAFNYAQENLDSWNLLITPTSKEAFGTIAAVAPQFYNVRRLFHSNYEADPFRIGKSQEELFENMAGEFLSTRGKGLLGLMKRTLRP